MPDDFDHEKDAAWADLLAPNRRSLLTGGGGLAAAGLAGLTLASAASAQSAPDAAGLPPGGPPHLPRKPHPPGTSPWGYETYKAPTPQPASVRPGEKSLPAVPRAYTDIKSYHAHFYFEEDSYHKAALLRKWSAERFHVELGDWNDEPRGPHVTPSFYFGFTNDLLPVIVPWLQLNSLGLTILLHPNTDDPRADHLYYALWVNRTQPVNAYNMKPPRDGEPRVEQIYPNTRPSVKLEA